MASASGRKLNIVVEGCCHGDLSRIYASVLKMEQVGLVVCIISGGAQLIWCCRCAVSRRPLRGPVRWRYATPTVVGWTDYLLSLYTNSLHYFVLDPRLQRMMMGYVGMLLPLLRAPAVAV